MATIRMIAHGHLSVTTRGPDIIRLATASSHLTSLTYPVGIEASRHQ